MQQRDPAAASISNLAITVGFGNISYFNKVFKRVLNMTPTEYKKQEGL
jgi:AraC-like DNA-binding protein